MFAGGYDSLGLATERIPEKSLRIEFAQVKRIGLCGTCLLNAAAARVPACPRARVPACPRARVPSP